LHKWTVKQLSGRITGCSGYLAEHVVTFAALPNSSCAQ